MARALFNLAVQDDEGDKVAGATVTFTKMDGSALGQSLYAAESGGAPELTHEADSQGMLARFVDTPTRVKYAINGGTPKIGQFDPDPGDILLGTSANLIYRDQASALDQYAGVADHVLTIQATTGGATGNKAFKVEDNAGAIAFEVAALGGGSALIGTYVNTDVGPLVVSNVRNWNTNADFHLGIVKLTGTVQGSHQAAVWTYQSCATPTDGFGGVANIPDHCVANFDYFAQNIASGASQNHDGSGRAIEIQTIVYQNTGQRTMAAMTVGIHTAVAKTSYTDRWLATGSNVGFTTENGDCGIIIRNDDQSAFTGFGTNRAGNTALLIAGAYGFAQSIAVRNTSDQTIFAVDSSAVVHCGGVYLTPGLTGTLGTAAKVWSQGHISTVIAGNGAAANPSVALLGAGASSDGLFGVVGAGVVGFTVAGVEAGRFNATGLTVTNALAVNGNTTLGNAAADTIALTGAVTALGARKISGATAVISPAQLVANTNDWNPTGLATAQIIRASTDASRNLTGLVAQADGVYTIVNVGSQNLVVIHESASSSAANRFNLPGGTDITLGAHGSVTLWYDTSGSRWKRLGA